MCPSHISGCIDSNDGQTNSGMRGFVHFCIQVLSCIHHALHIGTAMLISADDTGRGNNVNCDCAVPSQLIECAPHSLRYMIIMNIM